MFERAAREICRGRARHGDRSTSSSRARSTRTSSSPAAATARRTSSPITMSAACPTTCNSRWSSRCARCSRTRCAGSARSSACRRTSSGASRSRAGAGDPRGRRGHRRPARRAARRGRDHQGRATRAGLDREIWQCPVVLLAQVRSVGVQGDGRTYGHPVVLRPVTSEDAMTADWARLPDDVLAQDLQPDHQRGSAGQPGRARRDVQAAGHDRVGVDRTAGVPLGTVPRTAAEGRPAREPGCRPGNTCPVWAGSCPSRGAALQADDPRGRGLLWVSSGRLCGADRVYDGATKAVPRPG